DRQARGSRDDTSAVDGPGPPSGRLGLGAARGADACATLAEQRPKQAGGCADRSPLRPLQGGTAHSRPESRKNPARRARADLGAAAAWRTGQTSQILTQSNKPNSASAAMLSWATRVERARDGIRNHGTAGRGSGRLRRYRALEPSVAVYAPSFDRGRRAR